MKWNMTLDLSSIITSILTLETTIVVFYWSYRQYNQLKEQLKIQNEQIKLNFFSEYTKRYREIILHFPENINEKLLRCKHSFFVSREKQ
ncbi:MAG: hypothetical protein C4291_13640 [Candidatus Dadabacteria bacterium]